MDVVWQLLWVCAVLAAALAFVWWQRRGLPMSYGRNRTGRNIEVIERVALGPQSSLQVVRIGQVRIALAVHGSAVTVIERMPESTDKP